MFLRWVVNKSESPLGGRAVKSRLARSHLGKKYETDEYESDEMTRRDLQEPVRSRQFNDAAHHRLHFALKLRKQRLRNASEPELAVPFREMI